jgi:hypothetical protein
LTSSSVVARRAAPACGGISARRTRSPRDPHRRGLLGSGRCRLALLAAGAQAPLAEAHALFAASASR